MYVFLKVFFFKLLHKFINCINSNDYIRKITSKSIEPCPIFYSEKDLNKKNGLFLIKKSGIQVIITLTMLTRVETKVSIRKGFLIQATILFIVLINYNTLTIFQTITTLLSYSNIP